MQKLIGIVIALAAIATSSLPATAGDWRRDYRHYGGRTVVEHHYYRHTPRRLVRPNYYRHRHDNGAAIAAGILGFAIGAIVANEVARRHTNERETFVIQCEGMDAVSELARCPRGFHKTYQRIR